MTVLLAYAVIVAALFAATIRPRGVCVASAVLGVALAMSLVAVADLTGRPKPINLAAFERTAAEAILVGSHYVEDQAIWLWLMLPGETEPRAYALPWAQEMAEQMRRAQQEAEEAGVPLIVNDPFGERDFHPAPQPPMPEKEKQ